MQNLVNYIKKNLTKGYTLESLKCALINQGYSRIEVQRAIDITNKELAESAPKLKEKPIIRHELHDEENNIRRFEEKKPFWRRWFGFWMKRNVRDIYKIEKKSDTVVFYLVILQYNKL